VAITGDLFPTAETPSGAPACDLVHRVMTPHTSSHIKQRRVALAHARADGLPPRLQVQLVVRLILPLRFIDPTECSHAGSDGRGTPLQTLHHLAKDSCPTAAQPLVRRSLAHFYVSSRSRFCGASVADDDRLQALLIVALW